MPRPQRVVVGLHGGQALADLLDVPQARLLQLPLPAQVLQFLLDLRDLRLDLDPQVCIGQPHPVPDGRPVPPRVLAPVHHAHEALLICLAALNLLTSISARQPVAVFVDDLQWLDQPS